jgi:hypothetical protein
VQTFKLAQEPVLLALSAHPTKGLKPAKTMPEYKYGIVNENPTPEVGFIHFTKGSAKM